MRIEMTPIGIVHSCFDERFGVPRQPGLAPGATAELILLPPYDAPAALQGLEECSHVWILFLFHRNRERGWTPTVRPPRLGGNVRRGVFATRSPYRPNAIGLSVVELDGILEGPGRRGLRLRNHDLVDATPVLDIKPYLPYSDAIPAARGPAGFAGPPARRAVRFSPEAEASLARGPAELRALIVDVLSLDPRPAYRQGEATGGYGLRLAGRNVRWEERDGEACVRAIEDWPAQRADPPPDR